MEDVNGEVKPNLGSEPVFAGAAIASLQNQKTEISFFQKLTLNGTRTCVKIKQTKKILKNTRT